MASPRIGIGIDAHRLVSGRDLILGGEPIDYDRGLEGHSDGDVLLHALTDALLGAVAGSDIGSLFPSDDASLAGASSRFFLEKAVAMVAEKGYRVGNVDAVVVAEEPRLAPFVPKIRRRLAEILGVSLEAVSVKATTTDGLGFAGRGEGIAAQAVATVIPE